MKIIYILLIVLFIATIYIFIFLFNGNTSESLLKESDKFNISANSLVDNIKNNELINSIREKDTIEIKDDLKKEYSSSDKQITITQNEQTTSIKLLSEYNDRVNIGTDIKVAEFMFEDFDIKSEEGLYQSIRIFNLKDDFKEESRAFRLKYLYNDEWTEFKSFKELPSKNVIIGLFTEVKEGDYIEWVMNIKGFDILEWAKWSANSFITTGYNDIGNMATPEVFNYGGYTYTITGEEFGVFNGYVWNGTSWKENTSIVLNLGDIGFNSAPAFFNLSGYYYLISGNGVGTFNGFVKNTTEGGWGVNNTIINGLEDVGTYSSPEVFYMNGYTYLLTGNENKNLYGYIWNGTGWQSNSTIISGVTTRGSAQQPPAVFNIGTDWFMIRGDDTGILHGWNWTGTEWQNDTNIINGLADIGTFSYPDAFNINNIDYFIIGGADGTTDGYNLSVGYEPPPDTTYPTFSNYWDNNGTLTFNETLGNTTAPAIFNVTVANTNGTVILNIWGDHYQATLYGSQYVFSTDGVAGGGVWEYNWTSYGSGTNHLMNTSINRYYTIFNDTNATGDTTPPTWTNLRNFTHYVNTSFSESITATDDSGISSYKLNDTTNFDINITTGLITNKTALDSLTIYWLNITANDTVNNLITNIFYINLTIYTPPVLVGVSQCKYKDFGYYNLNLPFFNPDTYDFGYGGVKNIICT